MSANLRHPTSRPGDKVISRSLRKVASMSRTTTASAPIDQALATAIEQHGVPGAVALVTDLDGVLWEGAAGVSDVASRRPMALDAMFRIASMTKAVASVALMQLVEQGDLELDDAVAKFLPEVEALPVIEAFDARTGDYRLRPARTTMTVRHALTHTTGLGYPFTSETLRDLKPRNGETFPLGGPLLFDPGTRWWYGTSTDVVGRLVETISGKDLESCFREHVFAPLGMHDTSYDVPESKAGRLVAAHQRAGGRADGAIERMEPQPGLTMRYKIGGGGLHSTVGDYGRFLRCLLNGGSLGRARILRPETVALMGRNHIGDLGVPAQRSYLPRSADFSFIADGRDKWGLGFLINVDRVPGKRAAGSLAWAGINNTYFWIDPASGIAGTIMMQYLPFADARALAVYDAFERAAYGAHGRA